MPPEPATPAPIAARRATPEADAQRQIVRDLRAVLPLGAVVHFCGQEVRGASDWARRQQEMLVGMGAHPGFADLIVLGPLRSGAPGVLLIEVKSADGRASHRQQEFAATCARIGLPWVIARSSDDAIAALENHGFATRIRSWRP